MPAAPPLVTRRIRLAPGLVTLFLVIMVATPVLLALVQPSGFGSAIPAPAWITIAVVEVGLLASLLSWHRLEIDDDRIRLRWFPIYDRTLPLDELTGFEPVTVRFADHGVGLRVLGGGAIALVNRGGPGVRLEFTGGRSYVVALAADAEVDAVLAAVAQQR
ncbi:hypothetical protein [Schumannella sp. 10F1B-5-1]|uniref:hypothetical protein n=1 Tax=Schumannella sp. 10F1B-5-1 TaxID=2590780 RepID=UPI00112FDE4F|nr:hypothetical protein [Schumannella sp. 10F1B-5-1]TPW72852.1 hypothetical protein FJ658_06205 [Schumannella sp. 10F1B-5-1]